MTQSKATMKRTDDEASSNFDVTAKRTSAWWLWFGSLALASCLLVLAVWSVPYIPTHDGPQHVMSGHIENHYADPGAIYPRHLSPAPQFAARGFAFLFVPLESLLGWQDALRTVLSIIVLLGAWGFTAVVVSLNPQRRWTALAGFAGAIPWAFYMGFFSFVLGIALGMFLIAFCVARDPTKRITWVGTTFGLLVLSVVHLSSALVTTVVVGVILVSRTPHKRVATLLRMLLVALPVWCVLGLSLLGFSTLRDVPASGAWSWEPLSSWLHQVPHFVVPGPMWRGVVAILVLLLAWASFFVRRHRGEDRPAERGILIVSVLLFVGGCLSPLHVPGWQFVSARFIWLGALLGVTLLGPIASLGAGWARALLPASALLTAAYLWTTGTLHRRLSAGCSDSMAGLSVPVKRSGVQFPITFESHCGVDADTSSSEIPHLAPLRHVAGLYVASQGGTIPLMFQGSPSVHAFVAKEFDDDLPFPGMWALSEQQLHSPAFREAAVNYFAAYAAFYESLLVFGATPHDLDILEERGFVPRSREGGFMMAEFEGCPTEVAIVDAPGAGALLVQYAPWPLTEPTQSYQVSLTATPGLVRVPIKKSLCGNAWVRVVWRPPPELTSAKAMMCPANGPDGTMSFHSEGPMTTLPCRLGIPNTAH
jgi:hypothetical protein